MKIIETQKNNKEIIHNGTSFNEEDIITQNRLKMAQKMGAMSSNKLKKNKESVFKIFNLYIIIYSYIYEHILEKCRNLLLRQLSNLEHGH